MEWKWNGINESTRPAFVSFATAGKWVGEISGRHGKEMRPIEMDLFSWERVSSFVTGYAT